MQNRFRWRLIALLSALCANRLLPASIAMADDDDIPAKTSTVAGDSYGFLGLLDHRSKYGSDWFPELFRVDESDVSNEIRLDWQHLEGKHLQSDQAIVQVEKSFGLFTLEIQSPYTLDTPAAIDAGELGQATHRGHLRGIGTVEISGRLPVYQFVSKSGFFDNTLGINFDVGIPTNSYLSKNTELSPRLFDDLRLGNHLSLQTLFGPAWLLGTKPVDGRTAFEFGVGLGYAIEDEELPLPHVERTIPIFELVGESNLSGVHTGHSAITGTAGVRFELKPIRGIHAQLGLAYLFPIDQGGRDELHWGVITSLVFEF